MIECFVGKRVLNVNRQVYEKFYCGAFSKMYWVLKLRQGELEQKKKIKVLSGIS